MVKDRFEIGKAYQHTCGVQMYICGMADTIMYGLCFIAEEGWNREKLIERNAKIPDEIAAGQCVPDGGYGAEGIHFRPVSFDEEANVNWVEITTEEFIKNNTVRNEI